MILDIFALKRRGLDRENFFFEYNPENELIDIPGAKIKYPIKINGEMVLTGKHSAVVYGEITFVIQGDCTRCLAETEREYVVEFEESCSSEEEGAYPVVNDKINLDKIVDDTVITNQPVTILCKDDCKGICMGCGVNLNNAECKCNNKEGK